MRAPGARRELDADQRGQQQDAAGQQEQWPPQGLPHEAAPHLSVSIGPGIRPIARRDILGSPADVIRRLETFIDAGVRYFICNWSCDPSEVPRHLELIGNEVIPHFR